MVQYHGIVTNYKIFEGLSGRHQVHHYELSLPNDEYIYFKNNEGPAVAFGTEVVVRSCNDDAESSEKLLVRCDDEILGPLQKSVTTINYQGQVLDCYDRDFGLYNFDNKVLVLGSACLDFEIGNSVILYNFHVLEFENHNDQELIQKIFGAIPLKSKLLLVYCPVFSSVQFDKSSLQHDNLLFSRSDFSSLLYTQQWMNRHGLKYSGFEDLDNLASAFNEGKRSARFLGHCSDCAYTSCFQDFVDRFFNLFYTSPSEAKELLHAAKRSLLASSRAENEITNESKLLRDVILRGRVSRKSEYLFELSSASGAVFLFCSHPKFNPPENVDVLVMNPFQVVEAFPKPHIVDSWTVKAYYWITSQTTVWGSGYFFAFEEDYLEDLIANSHFVICKIVRKYVITKEFNHQPFGAVAIQIDSVKGPRIFLLSAKDKFYCCLTDVESLEVIRPRILISRKVFEGHEKDIWIKSNDIQSVIQCTLNAELDSNGAVQVKICDLSYLNSLSGLQFFSVKARIVNLRNLQLNLLCAKCKLSIQGSRCLQHQESFQPHVKVNAVFEISDVYSDANAYILIDKIPMLKTVMKWSASDSERIINYLKYSGEFKWEPSNANHSELESKEQLLKSVLQSGSFRGALCSFTFPVEAVGSILRPSLVKRCDIKVELLNLVNYLENLP